MGRSCLVTELIDCTVSETQMRSKKTEDEKGSYLCLDGQPQWLRDTLYRTLDRPTCSSFLASATQKTEQARVD
jgi:hypothetical protein